MTVPGTPIPAHVLTVDNNRSEGGGYLVRWADTGAPIFLTTAGERDRLLAAPTPPPGVPDNAALAEARKLAEHWRDRWNQHVASFELPGRPHSLPWEEGPYQPTPPADLVEQRQVPALSDDLRVELAATVVTYQRLGYEALATELLDLILALAPTEAE